MQSTTTLILLSFLPNIAAVFKGHDLMEMVRLCYANQEHHECKLIRDKVPYTSQYSPRLHRTRSYSNCEHECCGCQLESLWLSPQVLVQAYGLAIEESESVYIESVDGSKHNLQLIDIGYCKGQCHSPHRRHDLFHCSATEHQVIRIVYYTGRNPTRTELVIAGLKIKKCYCKARISCE